MVKKQVKDISRILTLDKTISGIDDLIALTRKKINLLEKMKKALSRS